MGETIIWAQQRAAAEESVGKKNIRIHQRKVKQALGISIKNLFSFEKKHEQEEFHKVPKKFYMLCQIKKKKKKKKKIHQRTETYKK